MLRENTNEKISLSLRISLSSPQASWKEEMDGAQGRKGGLLLCMDERRTTGKSITQQDNVTKDIRDFISHFKMEKNVGEAQKDKWKVKTDFIWG